MTTLRTLAAFAWSPYGACAVLWLGLAIGWHWLT